MNPGNPNGVSQQGALSVPLRIESPIALGAACQPVTVGVPFAKGALGDPQSLCLADAAGRTVPLQTEVLARWSDGSVKWLLVDFLLQGPPAGASAWMLQTRLGEPPDGAGPGIEVRQQEDALLVDTGSVTFEIDGRVFRPFRRIRAGQTLLAADPAMRATLGDSRASIPEIKSVSVETQGPLRTTIRADGAFPRMCGLRFRARLCFFGSTGLVRLKLTIHNPNRARHRGGLWDLADRGLICFPDLSVEFDARGQIRGVRAKPEVDQPLTGVADGLWSLYQDSSGGQNWQSPNHVNRNGVVPCRFRGYRLRTSEGEAEGLRAAPVVVLRTERAAITVAVPEFWQNFPKALEVDGSRLRVGLFPREWDDQFELQGGEQKTHTVWFCFEPAGGDVACADDRTRLDWVHRPARVVSTPEYYASTGVFPHLLPASQDPDDRLRTLLDGAIRGPASLLTRRETIDEYGWRNYGEVYADHENAHYEGPRPVISHYNNQFDVVYGAILQQMRTGEAAWSELFDPLARHVIDVDIYHTTRDRAAYNGGLFWLTDHYLSAETATHRTYSRANKPADGSPYGGGPGAEHNYATGLLHYYYLTGDREARAAVLGLADWVTAMDDGAGTVLGVLDGGPTGLASATDSPDYHGPGRGSANSIGVLLDGWLAGGDRKYLDKAEELIRRTIHPQDDVAARNLLDVEARWSYTMHLAAVARYLQIKIEQGELDFMVAYARESLLHYARWMLENERPYFDHPEDLEYPTEAWAAQEFRKANALRLAARWADEPLRSGLLARGGELADRAWADLLRFESRGVARAVAVMMVEGVRDCYYRVGEEQPAPKPAGEHALGRPEPFVPQRSRVKARWKAPGGLLQAAWRLANPRNWAAIVRRLRAARN